MEIPAFLKAGLSFSESPRYMVFLLSMDMYPSSEITVSKAMPLLYFMLYISTNGYVLYF